MKKILFVCTGNTCRSPMAQYLFNYKVFLKKLDNKYSAFSAGLSVFDSNDASTLAKTVLQNMGINISGHKAKRANESDIEKSFLILCMTNRHAQLLSKQFEQYKYKIYSISEFLNRKSDIEDPYNMGYETYEKTAKQLDEICEEIINKLEAEKI